MNANQLRVNVVRPALQSVSGWWTPAAENLVMGTASVESNLEYVKQLKGGSAISLWQIEAATHDDLWRNWLKYRPGIATAILRASGMDPAFGWALSVPHEHLMTNLTYGALMCRCYYRRIPAPLPAADDVAGMARYWKQHYNTSAGAGTIEMFLRFYLKVHPTMEARA